MPAQRRPAHAPVVFDAAAWAEDLVRTTQAGRAAALAGREAFERGGVPVTHLRACDANARDGTRLPGCVKVYLPLPVGEHGMVFEIARDRSGRLVLAYLAFGPRHPPHGTRRDSVYRIADRRRRAA